MRARTVSKAHDRKTQNSSMTLTWHLRFTERFRFGEPILGRQTE